MNNTFGEHVRLTLFGESHGQYIGCVLDGIPAGMTVNEESIEKALLARRPAGRISTARREEDKYDIVSGVLNGKTNGAPLCILIPNSDVKSTDYEDRPGILRPGHADFTSHVRNLGFEDHRGGGHFSGRLTAAIVAAGAVVADILEEKGIYICSHVLSIGDVRDRGFENVSEEAARLRNDAFPVLDDGAREKMKSAILSAKEARDSVGGVVECAVTGVPAGIGEPWFGTVEGKLSYALFSVPAVKGVEFGAGFALSKMRGSEANDAFEADDGEVATKTNNCGGVLGGLATGAPIVFRAAIKPTPTVALEQATVDLETGENVKHSFSGRHDPCIVHRAASVINAVTALTVADLLAARYAEEWAR
ncbi:MAG: chorismate synthase [Clostridia bacterium]|nr:chorismate synthase [Clostridia bacterium]